MRSVLISFILGFSLLAGAQSTTSPAEMPPPLPNPNESVTDDPTHGAIIQEKDKNPLKYKNKKDGAKKPQKKKHHDKTHP